MPSGAPTSYWPRSTCAPKPWMASATTAGRYPSPRTPEGAVVSWADRCAYCAHDLEDAASVGIVRLDDLPDEVVAVVGQARSQQLSSFVTALVDCIASTGEIGMSQPYAGALAALREFNYDRIYTRPSSVAQGRAVIAVLSALVEFFAANPAAIASSAPGLVAAPNMGDGEDHDVALRRAITYVSGMTDRFAFGLAVDRLGWGPEQLPRGIDSSGTSL